MSSAFDKLKRNSQGSDSLKKLNKDVSSMAQKGDNVDDRFWQPTVNKEKVGSAVIRFLPTPLDNDLAFQRCYEHSFQGKKSGRWFIEECLTTLGQDDPVVEYNNDEVWGKDLEKSPLVKKGTLNRKLKFYANILVIKDNLAPENEGKVFLFRFGKQVFDKINEASNPKEDGVEAFDPFNLWTGANFNLKITQVNKQRSYLTSFFSEPSECGKSDKVREKIWEKEYDLRPFVDPENGKFKSYDVLKKQLYSVLGITSTGKTADDFNEEDDTFSEKESDANEFDDFKDDGEDSDSFFAKAAADDGEAEMDSEDITESDEDKEDEFDLEFDDDIAF